MAKLPPFVPYPSATWAQHLTPQDWDALVEAWLALIQTYLSLSDADLKQIISQDESVAVFLSSFVEQQASSEATSHSSPTLLRAVFQLTSQLLQVSPPPQLLTFPFLADLAKVFPKKHVSPVLSRLFTHHAAAAEAPLTTLKKLLIPALDAGIKTDLRPVEAQLVRLSPLLHASPHACTLFLAGSDFFDGLVACFRIMNPPLRKAIVTTLYLCIVGLTEADPPHWSMLSDQLYTLKDAADAHKQGPLNVNDSLVADLVTTTPLLKNLLRRAEVSGAAGDSLKKRITALEAFKKGPMVRPRRLVRRKVDKGKGKATRDDVQGEMHAHRMSQVTQVQDLFPDLGAGFVAKCLDEYGDDVEQVVANLLGETLPPSLASADRTEPLSSHGGQPPDMAPHSTPPQIPTRRNIFDDDEFDRLAADTSKITFGKRPAKTADDILQDRYNAPNKAAIMSALAAFDSDDDERDDTYDAADVGGLVESTNQEADGVSDAKEEALFRAYQMDPSIFGRDAETKRGKPRAQLREESGISDEAIEGWAIMLARTPAQQRRLEAKYAFAGQQAHLGRTAWRESPAGSGAEEGDSSRGSFRGGRGRGRGQGRGGRGGNVAGPTGEKDTEKARRNKEANKGARANHNRRDGRARKMARGGFPG